MPFDVGINFRQTAGFVTDGANETYVVGGAYPITRGGATFGWIGGPAITAERSPATADRRLAGFNYVLGGAGSQKTFRLDLPAAGAYVVHLGLGDWGYNGAAGAWQVDLLDSDGSTVLASIAKPSVAGYYDAMGTPLSVTAWGASEQGRSVSISGTSIFARIGSGTSSDSSFTPIAHLRVVSAGGGGPAASIFRRTLYRRAGSRGVN